MTFMTWRPEYSVRVAIFDDEHKKLIAIINQLYEATQKGASPSDLDQICDHLFEYTLMHFRHEELYFDDWAYPETEAHVASHDRFRWRIFEYRKEIAEKDSPELAEEMLVFLREWLAYHIMVEDKAYGEYLYNKGLR